MKIGFAIAAIGATAALALAACGSEPEQAVDAAEAPASPTTSSEAPASPAADPAKGDKPTKEFLVGNWGTDGDCTLAMDLRADGTSDGPFGNWSYSDGVISFADAPEIEVSVTVIDSETMESINSSGKTSKMTRCP